MNKTPAPATDGPHKIALKVDAAQEGMKLLRFLERALADRARSSLHKWIRTGQVRVNGKRARAFDTLLAGDEIRLPPFALPLTALPPLPLAAPDYGAFPLPPEPMPGLEIVAAERDYLVLGKAHGLPSQDGSGHKDSAASWLARAFAGAAHVPAPAHRLDRDTSGLLLAGRSFAAQKRLHALFLEGAIIKDYLAWVTAAPAWTGPARLVDHLVKGRDRTFGRENTVCLPGGQSIEIGSAGKEQLAAAFAPDFSAPPALTALSLALPLRTPFPARPKAAPGARPCLLLLRLFTGRKHQLRAQLAARGQPVLGDRRYGPAPAAVPSLLLHAWRLRFVWPPVPDANQNREVREYRLPPPWPVPFTPAPQALAGAAALLDAAVRERLMQFLKVRTADGLYKCNEN